MRIPQPPDMIFPAILTAYGWAALAALFGLAVDWSAFFLGFLAAWLMLRLIR